MNAREVLEFMKKHKVQIVDLKFVDLIGTWQHFSIPTNELTEDLFKDGSGLTGPPYVAGRPLITVTCCWCRI
jgi:glutamine synthetase